MPDSTNPTGFVGFGQWSDLNADEEKDLMTRAFQAAGEKQTRASALLAQAGGEVDATHALSQTGSYQEYLAAKQDAMRAYAAVDAPTGNVWEDSLRATGDYGIRNTAHQGASGAWFDEGQYTWKPPPAASGQGAAASTETDTRDEVTDPRSEAGGRNGRWSGPPPEGNEAGGVGPGGYFNGRTGRAPTGGFDGRNRQPVQGWDINEPDSNAGNWGGG